MSKTADRLTKCADRINELIADAKNGLAKSLHLSTIDFSMIDTTLLDHIEAVRRGILHRWNDRFAKLKVEFKKHECMDSIKPCCMFSFYGAILKNIYPVINKMDYAKNLWLNYLKALRGDWESEKSFKM